MYLACVFCFTQLLNYQALQSEVEALKAEVTRLQQQLDMVTNDNIVLKQAVRKNERHLYSSP